MYKFLHLAAPALAILLLLSGCETAERDLDPQIERSTEQDTNINTPAQEDINASDDNTTEGEQQESKIAYDINVSFSDNYTQKGYFTRGEVGKIAYTIFNQYNNEPVNTTDIASITLRAEKGEEGKYFNFIRFDGSKDTNIVIDRNIKASDYVIVQANSLSGTTNLVIDVAFTDSGKPDIIRKIPIVIEKNKSASMAIVPFEDRYESGLFIKKFVIHVVDSYGNKAKDGTRISTGVINNPKLINKNGEGTLDKSNSEFTLIKPADPTITDNLQVTDTLITLANQQEYRPENLGGWDITDIMPQDSKLQIITLDKDPAVNHLSYIVGNEYRYDRCNDTIMNAAASTFESTEVKDGIAFAELRYVPAMVGKTVTIYANTRLNDKRIGISRVVALTGTGLQPVTITCSNEEGKNPTCSKTVTFIQNDSEKFAREALIGSPINTGDAEYAQISFPNGLRTDCNGNLKVFIANIDENKTASYTMGVVAKSY